MSNTNIAQVFYSPVVQTQGDQSRNSPTTPTAAATTTTTDDNTASSADTNTNADAVRLPSNSFLLCYHRNLNQCLSLCKIPLDKKPSALPAETPSKDSPIKDDSTSKDSPNKRARKAKKAAAAAAARDAEVPGIKCFRITDFDFGTTSSSLKQAWEFNTQVDVLVVCALALEYYGAFLLITYSKSHYSVLYIDIKERKVFSLSLPEANLLTCGDFDNCRKDLVTGSADGCICVYSVRPTAKISAIAAREPIQFLFRKRIKIPFGPTAKILDVKTQDLTSLIFICSNEGLCAVDASTLEIIWVVSSAVFNLTPISIAVDKFGSDFLVRCHNEAKNIDVLEFFTPPRSIFAADRGQFSRICIPVGEAVSFATIETFEDSIGPVIAILTNSMRLHIYRPSTKSREFLAFQCSVPLRGSTIEDFSSSDRMLQYNYKDRNTLFKTNFDNFLFESLLLSGGVMCFSGGAKAKGDLNNIYLIVGRENGIYVSVLVASSKADSKTSEILSGFNEIQSSIGSNPYNSMLSQSSAHFDITRFVTFDKDSSKPAKSKSKSGGKNISSENKNKNRDRDDSSDSLHGESLALDLELDPLDNKEIADLLSIESRRDLSTPNPVIFDLRDRDDDSINTRDSFGDSIGEDLYEDAAENRDIFSLFDDDARRMKKLEDFDDDLRSSHPCTINFTPAYYFAVDIESLKQHHPLGCAKVGVCPSALIRSEGPVLDVIKGGALAKGPSLEKQNVISLITRNFLSNIENPLREYSEIKVNVKMSSFASRIGFLGVLSELKEVILYDIKRPQQQSANSATCIKLDLDIKASVSMNVILMADVVVKVPKLVKTSANSSSSANSNSKTQNNKQKGASKSEKSIGASLNIHDTFMFCFLGDSNGHIHFSMCSKTKNIFIDQFKAHSSPVLTLLTTGDALRPLWRISTLLDETSTFYIPQFAPGSALITISVDSEINVWHPNFVFAKGSKAINTDNLFNGCKIEWKLAASFVANKLHVPLLMQAADSEDDEIDFQSRSNKNAKSRAITSATLDPTCTTIIIGFSDGILEQWNIPALLPVIKGSLLTSREPLWASHNHKSNVKSLRLWIHAMDTTVSDFEIDPNGDRERQISSFGSVVTGAGASNEIIAYSREALRKLAERSSLISSSSDNSLILWRFMISKPFSSESRSRSVMYMNIIPCRRFNFSSSVSQGICYCDQDYLVHPDNQNWRVEAIVSGEVVCCANGPRVSLFNSDPNISLFHPLLNKLPSEQHLKTAPTSTPKALDNAGSNLESIPVVVQIVRSNRVVQATHSKLGANSFCWDLILKWASGRDTGEIENLPGTGTIVAHKLPPPVVAKVVEHDIIMDNGKLIELATTGEGKVKVAYEKVHMAVEADLVDFAISQLKRDKTQKHLASDLKPPPMHSMDDTVSSDSEGSIPRGSPSRSITRGKLTAASGSLDIFSSNEFIPTHSIAPMTPSSNIHTRPVSPKTTLILSADHVKYSSSPPSSAKDGEKFFESLEIQFKSKEDMTKRGGNDGVSAMGDSIPSIGEGPTRQQQHGNNKYGMSEMFNVKTTKAQQLLLAKKLQETNQLDKFEKATAKKTSYISRNSLEKTNDAIDHSNRQTTVNTGAVFARPKATYEELLRNPPQPAIPEYQNYATLETELAKHEKKMSKSKKKGLTQVLTSQSRPSSGKAVLSSGTCADDPHRILDDNIAGDIEEENKKAALANSQNSKHPGHLDTADDILQNMIIDDSIIDFLPPHPTNNNSNNNNNNYGGDGGGDDNDEEELAKGVPIVSASGKFIINSKPQKGFEGGLKSKSKSKTKTKTNRVLGIDGNEDEEPDALPTTYFDKTAPPIIPNPGEKPKVKRLISKRLAKKKQLTEEEVLNSDGLFSLIDGSLRSQMSLEEKREMRNVMHDLEDEDIDKFIQLDNPLHNEVVTSVVDAVRDYNKKMIEQSIAEESLIISDDTSSLTAKKDVMKSTMQKLITFALVKQELQRLNKGASLIEVSANEVKKTHNSTTGSYTSSVNGKLLTVVLLRDEIIPVATMLECIKDPEKLKSVKEVKAYSGVVDCKAGIPVIIECTGLKTFTWYNSYTYCLRESKNGDPMIQEAFDATEILFQSNVEPCDLEWSRLSADQQEDEIKAACRSTFVQKAAREYRKLDERMPTDEDIKTKNGKTPDSKAALKKYQEFVSWWTNGTKEGFTPHRSQFLFVEVLYFLQNDTEQIQQCIDFEILTKEELDVLQAQAKEVTSLSQITDKAPTGTPFETNLLNYVKFRSWYKAGEVVVNKFEKDASTRTAITDTMATDTKTGAKDSSRPGTTMSQSRSRQDTADKSVDAGGGGGGGGGEGPINDDVESEEQLAAANAKKGKPLSFEACFFNRFKDRRQFLVDRIKNNDDCAFTMQKLFGYAKFCDDNGLSMSDIMFKRSTLKEDAVFAIMGLKKLHILCCELGLATKELPVKATLLGGNDQRYSAQSIGRYEPFGNIDAKMLSPEDPPMLGNLCLPDSNRRPLKVWQLCCPEEKKLELIIASQMDLVLELAFMDGVAVPDPEDAFLDPKVFPTRAQRWDDFMVWYAGEEERVKIAGQGRPTEQRVIFSEKFEAKTVDYDPWVSRLIVDKFGQPLPASIMEWLSEFDKRTGGVGSDLAVVDFQDIDICFRPKPPKQSQSEDKIEEKKSNKGGLLGKKSATKHRSGVEDEENQGGEVDISLNDGDVGDDVRGDNRSVGSVRSFDSHEQKMAGSASDDAASLSQQEREEEVEEELHNMPIKRQYCHKDGKDFFKSELVNTYEACLTEVYGPELRYEFLRKAVDIIMKSRRFTSLKMLFYPNTRNFGSHLSVPNSSIILPNIQFPAPRIKVFPSKSIESYTHIEICNWYSPEKLMDDDVACLKAEAMALKRRAYLEWLSHEPERVKQSQKMMLEEDHNSHYMKEYLSQLETSIVSHAMKLVNLNQRDIVIKDGLIATESYSPDRAAERAKYLAIAAESKTRKRGENGENDEDGDGEDDEDVDDDDEDYDDDEDDYDDDGDEGDDEAKEEAIRAVDEDVKVMKEEIKIILDGGVETTSDGDQPTTTATTAVTTTATATATATATPTTSATTTTTLAESGDLLGGGGGGGEVDEQMLSRSRPSTKGSRRGGTREGSRGGSSRRKKRGGGGATSRGNDGDVDLGFDDIDKALKKHQIFSKDFLSIADFKESVSENYYEFSNGLQNDDDIEDLAQIQMQSAKEANKKEAIVQNRLNVERLRREKEEIARLKRIEQDQRLAEGIERRRLIRANLDDIKQQRIYRKLDEERFALEAIRLKEKQRLDAIEAKRYEAEQARLRKQEAKERDLMEWEDIYIAELVWRRKEVAMMEHEDIYSILREKYDVLFDIHRLHRTEELKLIYEPFEPFQFKKDRVKLKELQYLLGQEDKDDNDANALLPLGGSTVNFGLLSSNRPNSSLSSSSSSTTATTATIFSASLNALPTKPTSRGGGVVVVDNEQQQQQQAYFDELLLLADPAEFVSSKRSNKKKTKTLKLAPINKPVFESQLSNEYKASIDFQPIIDGERLKIEALKTNLSTASFSAINYDNRETRALSLSKLIQLQSEKPSDKKKNILLQTSQSTGNLASDESKLAALMQEVDENNKKFQAGASQMKGQGRQKRIPYIDEYIDENDGDPPMLSPRSKGLAIYAGQKVNKFKSIRQEVQNYLEDDGVFKNNFFLKTFEPGVHEFNLLDQSPVVSKFHREIVNARDNKVFFQQENDLLDAAAAAAAANSRNAAGKPSMKNIRTVTKMRVSNYNQTIKNIDDDFDIKKRQFHAEELRKFGGIRGKVATILPVKQEGVGVAMKVSESIDSDSVSIGSNKSSVSMIHSIRLTPSQVSSRDPHSSGDVKNSTTLPAFSLESDSLVKQNIDAISLIDHWVDMPGGGSSVGGAGGNGGVNTSTSFFGLPLDGSSFDGEEEGEKEAFNNHFNSYSGVISGEIAPFNSRQNTDGRGVGDANGDEETGLEDDDGGDDNVGVGGVGVGLGRGSGLDNKFALTETLSLHSNDDDDNASIDSNP